MDLEVSYHISTTLYNWSNDFCCRIMNQLIQLISQNLKFANKKLNFWSRNFNDIMTVQDNYLSQILWKWTLLKWQLMQPLFHLIIQMTAITLNMKYCNDMIVYHHQNSKFHYFSYPEVSYLERIENLKL